ncbi:class I SAM-dependent methyltransferase [Acidobacteriota bacterium]
MSASCSVCRSLENTLIFPQMNVYHCQRCDLWFKYPVPTPEELEAIYQDYFQDEESFLDGTSALLAGRIFNSVRKYLRWDSFRDKKIMDFGAGNGNISVNLMEQGALIRAVEPDVRAREVLEGKGVKTYCDVKDVPSPGDFDLILCIEVIEHLPDPLNISGTLNSILKPGGVLYLTTPNRMGLKARVKKSDWKEVLYPGHLQLFNSRSMKYLLHASNFSAIRRDPYHINLRRKKDESVFMAAVQHGLQALKLDSGLRYYAFRSKR